MYSGKSDILVASSDQERLSRATVENAAILDDSDGMFSLVGNCGDQDY